MKLPWKKEADPKEAAERLPIGVGEIRGALQRLARYKAGKSVMDQTIIENEEWYRIRHWRYLKKGSPAAEPASAWLFNALMNKHADFMDNMPEATFLPRCQDDEAEADRLTAVVPVILERNNFEDCYSDTVWYKIKHGMGIYAATWDPKADHGIGDVSVKRVDALNFFCEPGVRNIQDSRDIFVTHCMSAEAFRLQYPDVEGNLSSGLRPEKFHTDDRSASDDVVVVDWYYKKQSGGRTVLHYVKFAGDVVLFASENDPAYRDGFYHHGRYPFVVDCLFPLENSVFGFGFVAVGRDPQMQIDKMSQLFLENLAIGAKPRIMVSSSLGLKIEDLADLSKSILQVKGNIDSSKFVQLPHASIDGVYFNVYQAKIEELKETTANRDVNSGGSASGVTSGAAISALQESGNKTSRDMINASYRAFTDLIYLIVELVRQFYDEPRFFRLTDQNGNATYTTYSNAGLQPQPMAESDTGRVPQFDIKVKAHKRSPYSRISQNELAVQLYQMGVFNPQIADQALQMLDMMDFEGKDKVVSRVAQGQTYFNMLNAMKAEMDKMLAIIQRLTGQGGGMPKPAEQSTEPAVPSGNVSGEMLETQKAGQTPYGEKLAERAVADVNNA